MIEKTLSKHIIMVILYFWAKNVVFEPKKIISQNTGLLQNQE